MAFKMNSPLHKATKAPVVSSARTKADASLVHAGQELGKSYIPGAIDYSIETRNIDFDDSDDKKNKKKKGGKRRKKADKKVTLKNYNKEKNRGADDLPQYNEGIIDESGNESAFTQRNNKTLKRIYRNAIPGGSVQKNLIKKGFDPKK
jgi:hypothetical protein